MNHLTNGHAANGHAAAIQSEAKLHASQRHAAMALVQGRLFQLAGLPSSSNEARHLITQHGASPSYTNGKTLPPFLHFCLKGRSDFFFQMYQYDKRVTCTDRAGSGVLTYLSLDLVTPEFRDQSSSRFQNRMKNIGKLITNHFRESTLDFDTVGACLLHSSLGISDSPIFDMPLKTYTNVPYGILNTCFRHVVELTRRFAIESATFDEDETKLEAADRITDKLQDTFETVVATHEDALFRVSEHDAKMADVKNAAIRDKFRAILDAKKPRSVKDVVSAIQEGLAASPEDLKLFLEWACDKFMGDWKREFYDSILTELITDVENQLHGRTKIPRKDFDGFWRAISEDPVYAEAKLDVLKDRIRGKVSRSLSSIEVCRVFENAFRGRLLEHRKWDFKMTRLTSDSILRRHCIHQALVYFKMIKPVK